MTTKASCPAINEPKSKYLDPVFLGGIFTLLCLVYFTTTLDIAYRDKLDALYRASHGSWVYSCNVADEQRGPERTNVTFSFLTPNCANTRRIQSVPNNFWSAGNPPYSHDCWSECSSICESSVSIVRNLEERGYYKIYVVILIIAWCLLGTLAITAIITIFINL